MRTVKHRTKGGRVIAGGKRVDRERLNELVAAKILGVESDRLLVMGTDKDDRMKVKEFEGTEEDEVDEWADGQDFESWTARPPGEAVQYAVRILEVAGAPAMGVVVEQMREWAKDLKRERQQSGHLRGVISGLEQVADDLEAVYGTVEAEGE